MKELTSKIFISLALRKITIYPDKISLLKIFIGIYGDFLSIMIRILNSYFVT